MTDARMNRKLLFLLGPVAGIAIFVAVVWNLTLWAAHQMRNSLLRVASSPTRSVRARSYG